MNAENKNEADAIMAYVKSASLKGSVEIDEHSFLWDLGGVYLQFYIDAYETTVFYSYRKSRFFNRGHFHEDNCDIISLIDEINDKDKIVRITFHALGSSFCVVDKACTKKKSRLFIRRYYSTL